MTMIDPFSHQNFDIISPNYHNYCHYYDIGMSRLQGYECNYAKTTFLVADSSSEAAPANLVDFPMADHGEDPYSRTTESHDHHRMSEPPPPPPPPGSTSTSTSRDFDQDAGGWLNLGLGRPVTNKPMEPTSSSPSGLMTRPAGLLELTLVPGSTTQSQQPSTVGMMSPPYNNNSLMFQQSSRMGVNYYSAPRHQDLNLVFRPTLHHDNIPFRNSQSLASAPASNYNFLPTSNSTTGSNYYFTSPPTFPQLRPTAAASAAASDVAAGPSFDFRVISPPRRPHSGLWFILQASQTQSKEAFLPQIPKSYLRIKDGRMTVGMLMKYLVNKLNLGSESEIEIRCKGQPLVPVLTLQYVRDNIWRSRETATTTGASSSSTSSSRASVTTDHVMLLHYSRTFIVTAS